MNQGSHLAAGSLQGFVGSAISLPTGLITAAFLTRQLGPENYGLLTVAATIVGLIEISITTGFCRSAEKFVAESERWQSVATKYLQSQLLAAICIAALLAIAAPIFGSLLNAPEVSFFLRVYSLGIPITALGNIHQSILIGRGHFSRRAILLGAYWVFRLVLVILFVNIYPSVTTVIIANIGASTLTLIWARVFISPAIVGHSNFPVKKLWNYAWSLFFYSVGINLFRQLDLLFVKALCEAPQMAGFYGATKNLTIVPILVATSLSPLLLAKLSRLSQHGHEESARIIGGVTMRVILCLLPFAGLAAGSAPELVTAIYGIRFSPAAPLLAVLIFGALGITMVTVTVAILIAAGRPNLPFHLTGPFVPLAIGFHLLLIPRFGAIGAAVATAVLSWAAAGATMLAVYRMWNILPSSVTLLRSIMVCGLAYTFAVLWPAPGFLLVLKLSVIGIVIVFAFLLLGEFSSSETFMIRSLFSGLAKRSQR
jgi:O-antigen/teichoic acid export membrane protein